MLPDITDLSWVTSPPQWEIAAIEELRRRQQELEEMVRPFVTTDTTEIPVIYQGDDCFLQPDSPPNVRDAAHALASLNPIISILDLVDYTTSDLLIRAMRGFLFYDLLVDMHKVCGRNWMDATIDDAQYRAGQTKRAQKKRKLAADEESLVLDGIRELNAQGKSVHHASRIVASQLSKGTFSGLLNKRIDIKPDTLRRKFGDRIK